MALSELAWEQSDTLVKKKVFEGGYLRVGKKKGNRPLLLGTLSKTRRRAENQQGQQKGRG